MRSGKKNKNANDGGTILKRVSLPILLWLNILFLLLCLFSLIDILNTFVWVTASGLGIAEGGVF